MITFEEAEIIRDEQLKKISKSHRTKIVQASFREFELGWILSFNGEKYIKNGSLEDILLGAGVIIIDKNDGSTTSLATHPVYELIGISIEELYKKEKYNIPIENEKGRIENFFQKNKINSETKEIKRLKSLEEREVHKKTSLFYKIYNFIKDYLDS